MKMEYLTVKSKLKWLLSMENLAVIMIMLSKCILCFSCQVLFTHCRTVKQFTYEGSIQCKRTGQLPDTGENNENAPLPSVAYNLHVSIQDFGNFEVS